MFPALRPGRLMRVGAEEADCSSACLRTDCCCLSWCLVLIVKEKQFAGSGVRGPPIASAAMRRLVAAVALNQLCRFLVWFFIFYSSSLSINLIVIIQFYTLASSLFPIDLASSDQLVECLDKYNIIDMCLNGFLILD